MHGEKEYLITKTLNNNVILAIDNKSKEEVVLVGKGIGFGKKDGNIVKLGEKDIEKSFLSFDEKTKNKYDQLVKEVNRKVIGVSEEIIAIAEMEFGMLNSNIHVALADHIGFAIDRIKMGLDISNPFIYEIQALYPNEYQVARKAQELIKDRLGIVISESEIGFIALHIHSARESKQVIDTIKDTKFLKTLVNIIEEELSTKLDNSGLVYSRLINHLRASISRMEKKKYIENPLLDTIKEKFSDSFDIAKKIGVYINKEKNIYITDDELGYMALHIERIRETTD
ncbi:MAG: PRD domain-containing protein [Tissierellia bacterium]|nr:PRD domain-containing protein [Tissierellia bacterium]